MEGEEEGAFALKLERAGTESEGGGGVIVVDCVGGAEERRLEFNEFPCDRSDGFEDRTLLDGAEELSTAKTAGFTGVPLC